MQLLRLLEKKDSDIFYILKYSGKIYMEIVTAVYQALLHCNIAEY